MSAMRATARRPRPPRGRSRRSDAADDHDPAGPRRPAVALAARGPPTSVQLRPAAGPAAGHHARMNDPFDRSFRDRVLGGETLLGLFHDLGSPIAAELSAAAGYDWILVDLEHGSSTEGDLMGLIPAVEVGGSTPLVRPQSGERLRIGRALDMGARGIM